ncbi:DNA gyrase subunit A, partial [Acholeplasma sp. OttesenSCG-928-E16]|nr:DNA gyrase subunit A [Acholeplasma sp. OttesenSCG-928-E16]
ELIKTSQTGEIAKERLIAEYNFSDEQAKAILDMRLQRLTGLEIEKIKEEETEIRTRVIDLKDIINSDERKESIVKEELLEIKDKYADERRSEINLSEDLDIEDEELIPVEDVIVTVTNNGYIKRMNVDQYKSQHRGGVGFAGIKMHEDDFVEHIQLTSTHDFHLFFTDKGRVFKIKGYKIPIGSRQSKGIPIVNLLKLQDNEKLASFTSIKDFDDENSHLFFVTKNGVVKKTDVSDYKNIRTNGIIALTLREDDELISVSLTDGKREIIIGGSHGKAIRFNEADVRSMGRTATGVRGMNLPEGEKVVGAAIVLSEEQEILVVTENGFGKRTNVDEYRLQTRGGKGVKTLNVTEKNGRLTALKTVNNDEDLIVITDKGVVIRTSVEGISQTKRATQGVRIIKLKQDQKVSTVALIPHQDEEDDFLEDSPNFIQEEIQIDESKKTDAIEMQALEKEEDQEVIIKKSMFDEE